MANEEHLKILKEGAKVWNDWRKKNPEIEPDLNNIHLMGSNLRDAESFDDELPKNLHKVDLDHVDLFEHEGVDLSNAELNNSALTGFVLEWAELPGVKMRNTFIHRVEFSGVNLTNAELHGSSIGNTDLSGASLAQSSFSAATLVNVDFRMADLKNVDFSNAHLNTVDLSEAELHGANFQNAYVEWLTMSDLDLNGIRGLGNALHGGPCSIATSTFELTAKSLSKDTSNQNQIEIFLRNSGVQEEYIQLFRSRIRNPIEYYSCFISYSSKDQEFAQLLHSYLQNEGVRCWFAPEDMKIGDQIRPRIDYEIRLRDKLLVILSENSIRSEWVGDEVEGALEEESKSNRLVLFPIRLDEAVMSARNDWAAKIKRRRHIGDFSNWKDKASYQRAFERLLRDLKATGGEVHGE